MVSMKSLLLSILSFLALPQAAAAQECVVLLHSLERSSLSMKVLEWRLSKEGYNVVSIDHPLVALPRPALADQRYLMVWLNVVMRQKFIL